MTRKRGGPAHPVVRPARSAALARAPRLAKLETPRLAHPVRRERLLRRLSESLPDTIVWIAGPPGAGKTTLAADYAGTFAGRCAWYQVDAGDSDVASFFHYFEQAMRGGARGRAKPLPRYGRESSADLAGFTRRFARAAFARLPDPSLVVFDNVHEASGPEFNVVLSSLLEEVPRGISVIMVSRSEPHADYPLLVSRGRIRTLDAETLRFTGGEAKQLLSSRKVPGPRVARITEAAQGWAAGLVVMGEYAGGSLPAPPTTQELLFTYFATQVIDRLKPEWQRFLMVTSFLPRVTAIAGDALAGGVEGRMILETLHRMHLFVDRRSERRPTYLYHALFREFLADLARRRLQPAELAQLRERAGAVAEAEGWGEDAVDLYIEAGQWAPAARLVAQLAQPLLEQGRAGLVEQWIERLPPEILAMDFELAYALGHARMHRDELAAREAFTLAHDGFASRGNDAGRLLSVCAMLETFYVSYRQWSRVDFWIETERALRERVGAPRAGLARLRADTGHLIALLMSADRDDTEALELEKGLMAQLADAHLDVNDRLRAAAMMIDMCHRLPRWAERLEQLLAIARPLAAHPIASPLLKERMHLYCAPQFAQMGREQEARNAIAQARALVEQYRWEPARFEAAYHELRCEFTWRDADRCSALLDEALAVALPGEPAHALFLGIMRYYVAILRGDRALALESAREAVNRGRETGLPSADLSAAFNILANALALNGLYDEAAATYRDAAGVARGFHRSEMRTYRELMLALGGLHKRPNTHLKAGLGMASRTSNRVGVARVLRAIPESAAALCEAALHEGIETVFVRDVIKAARLRPADPYFEDWPWPFTVRTLGSFEIAKEGRVVAVSGKAARRPLELLKFIVTSGRRSVPAAQAIAALWADLDGDQAKSAFNVALHRLRRLLGDDDAIELNEGRLSLAEGRFWVDMHAFEHYCALAEAEGPSQPAASPAAETALSLYRATLLRDEEEQPWWLVHRTRLAEKHTRVATLLGRQWMAAGRAELARGVFERAIDVDPLAEEAYRQLMLVLLAMGRHAEALKVYRRCREMLSVVLGMAPSPETDRIYREIRNP